MFTRTLSALALVVAACLAIIGCDDSGGSYGSKYSGGTGAGGGTSTAPPSDDLCHLPSRLSVWASTEWRGTLFLANYADGNTEPRQVQGEQLPDSGYGRDIDGFVKGDCGPLTFVLPTAGKMQIDASEGVQFYEGDKNALDILYRQKFGANATPDPKSSEYAGVVQFWLACWKGDLQCDLTLLPGGTFLHRNTTTSFGDGDPNDSTVRIWITHFATVVH